KPLRLIHASKSSYPNSEIQRTSVKVVQVSSPCLFDTEKQQGSSVKLTAFSKVNMELLRVKLPHLWTTFPPSLKPTCAKNLDCSHPLFFIPHSVRESKAS